MDQRVCKAESDREESGKANDYGASCRTDGIGGVEMEIKRGDIFYIAKGNAKTTGSEQYPDRPAVIVSNDKCNEYSSCVEIVYMTTQEKNPLPTHVDVMCHVPSIALCESVNTISKERICNYIRSCTDREMKDIDEALLISLGIDNDECDINNKFWTMIRELEEENRRLQLNTEIKYVMDDGKITKLGESEEVIALQTKCELYKQQYEALLEKLLAR